MGYVPLPPSLAASTGRGPPAGYDPLLPEDVRTERLAAIVSRGGWQLSHHARPHAAQFILDTYMKGYRNFDVEEAYAGIRKNATEASMLPWRHNALTTLDRAYFEKGFFPAPAYGEKESVLEVRFLDRRKAVSGKLAKAYNDL